MKLFRLTRNTTIAITTALATLFITSTPQACGHAPPEVFYSDIPTGFAACQAHAKANGYALKIRDTKEFRALFVCDRAGKYDSRGKQRDVHDSKRRLNTGSKKCGCKMRITLAMDRISGQWQVKVLEGIHNHAVSANFTAHLAHRIAFISAEMRASIDALAKLIYQTLKFCQLFVRKTQVLP